MRCPKCGYISFDHSSSCPKCSRNLSEIITHLHHTSPIKGGNVSFLESALLDEHHVKSKTEKAMSQMDAETSFGDDAVTLDLSEIGGSEAEVGVEHIDLPTGEELPVINLSELEGAGEIKFGGEEQRIDLNLEMGGVGMDAAATARHDEMSETLVPLGDNASDLEFDIPFNDPDALQKGFPSGAKSTPGPDEKEKKSTSSPVSAMTGLDLSLENEENAGGIKDSAEARPGQGKPDNLSVGLEEISLSDLVPLEDMEAHSEDEIFDLSDIMSDSMDLSENENVAGSDEGNLTRLGDGGEGDDEVDLDLSMEDEKG